MINEEFKQIKDFPDYLISNLGNVYSNKTNKYLKQQDNGDGYLCVQLGNAGTFKSIKVHRLVAEAFIENKENLPCVNHKDLNKHNNCIENLEWCTYQYNINYQNPRFGKTRTAESKEKMSIAAKARGANNCKAVICLETNIVYNSATEASKFLNLNNQAVATSIRRKTKCGGYTWAYLLDLDFKGFYD